MTAGSWHNSSRYGLEGVFGDKEFDKEGGQSNLVLMKLTYQSIRLPAQFSVHQIETYATCVEIIMTDFEIKCKSCVAII